MRCGRAPLHLPAPHLSLPPVCYPKVNCCTALVKERKRQGPRRSISPLLLIFFSPSPCPTYHNHSPVLCCRDKLLHGRLVDCCVVFVSRFLCAFRSCCGHLPLLARSTPSTPSAVVTTVLRTQLDRARGRPASSSWLPAPAPPSTGRSP